MYLETGNYIVYLETGNFIVYLETGNYIVYLETGNRVEVTSPINLVCSSSSSILNIEYMNVQSFQKYGVYRYTELSVVWSIQM